MQQNYHLHHLQPTKAARTADEEVTDRAELLAKIPSDVEDEGRKEDKIIFAMPINGVDVSEVFSPPRVVTMAVRMGLIGGSSMDLKTGWDVSKWSYRRKALASSWPRSRSLSEFSIIQNPNLHMYKDKAEWMRESEERTEEAIGHIN